MMKFLYAKNRHKWGWYAVSILIAKPTIFIWEQDINNPNSYIDQDGESIAIALAATTIIRAGVASGVFSYCNGNGFAAGFVNGAVAALGTEIGTVIAPGVGTIMGSTIGSAMGSILADYIRNPKADLKSVAHNAAKSAVVGIISGVSSTYWNSAIEMANSLGSAAQVLTNYDSKFGEAIKYFFSTMGSMLSEEMNN